MKVLTRKDLKSIKRRIEKVINENSTVVEGFKNIGDNIFDTISKDIRFYGRITKKELNNSIYDNSYKVKEQGNYAISFQRLENNKIEFFVSCAVVDEYGIEEEAYITLNI